MHNIIPKPVMVTETGDLFTLTGDANICVEPGTAEMTGLGQYLAEKLRPATGYPIRVLERSGSPTKGDICLSTVGADPGLGGEGYEITITRHAVNLSAHQPAGVFRGIHRPSGNCCPFL
jgi:hexosaminidase